MIPNEAIEAAALAIARVETGDDGETFANDIDRIFARAALEAALPYLSEAARHQRRSPTDWPDIPKARS